MPLPVMWRFFCVSVVALCLSDCITTPTNDSGINLDRVQLSDSDLTCDGIKEEISKLDALQSQMNVSGDQSAATSAAVATAATTGIVTTGATTAGLAFVPIVGPVVLAASMVGTASQVQSAEDQSKIQIRKAALNDLYISKDCDNTKVAKVKKKSRRKAAAAADDDDDK